MRCLAGVSWGSDPAVLSLLYKSVVRSHFDYSFMAYIGSAFTSKLDGIQNRALRIISGAMCSTPIRAMEVETNVMPLVLRRIELGLRYCLKLITSKNEFVINRIIRSPTISTDLFTRACNLLCGINPTSKELFSYAYKEYSNIFHNYYTQWPCYSGTFKSKTMEISSCTVQIHTNTDYLEYVDSKPDFYKIFTDGSKSEHHVRSAIYDPITKFKQSYKIDINCTIFTAEAYAVFKALQYIKCVHNCKNFIIFTDSLSLIQCLQNTKLIYKQNYIVFLIRELVYYFEMIKVKIIFKWIPSHRGITGNEEVDNVAFTGLNEVECSDSVKVPFTDYYASIKLNTKKLWMEMWKKDQEVKGKWYGTIQTELPVKPWYCKERYKNATRDFITTINRLRFGHHKTPGHLARLNIVPENKCNYCNSGEVGHVEHIIFQCRTFSIERLVLASEIVEVTSDDNNSENDFMHTDYSRRLKNILMNEDCFVPVYKFIKNSVQNL